MSTITTPKVKKRNDDEDRLIKWVSSEDRYHYTKSWILDTGKFYSYHPIVPSWTDHFSSQELLEESIKFPNGLTILIPSALDGIAKEIKKSKSILELEIGWDYENAEEISSKVYYSAIDFLARISRYLFENFTIHLSTPEINPVRNGTIDISWRTEKARILINVKEKDEKIVIAYYGDLGNNESPYSGSFRLSESSVPFEALAVWMKQLD